MSQQRTCAELGLCQGDGRCDGCTYDDSGLGEFDYPHSPALPADAPRQATPRHAFAPGVIDGPAPASRAQVAGLLAWLLGLSLALGFCAGVVSQWVALP